ncbi:hypothetical protein BDC45DRAFT_532358 [Circinella umbellata]|nr:hypothetical protein BDC45DRAFT_532358 [Circinella umbellata]
MATSSCICSTTELEQKENEKIIAKEILTDISSIYEPLNETVFKSKEKVGQDISIVTETKQSLSQPQEKVYVIADFSVLSNTIGILRKTVFYGLGFTLSDKLSAMPFRTEKNNRMHMHS